ncbi:MAG TPA: ATP-binding protein [Desulfobacteraceae bacterium]|nr:ATP-binding protein [Desulfobacteraceae bacterium]HPJ66356.1 ATP-binding protein [Desulfobacteraceae bacterium]
MLSIEVENRIKQMNPWIIYPDKIKDTIGRFLPIEYIHRSAEKTFMQPDRAFLVVGPRQSGKSTMVWHEIHKMAPNVLFLNMEDPLLRMGCRYSADIVEHLQQNYPFIEAVFIDEIQHMEEAGLFIKGLVDAKLNLYIWVTGSSSFDLRSKTRESLAGRAARKRLLPFSLMELKHHADAPNPIAEKHTLDRIISHQLIFGSYPSIYLSEEYEEKITRLNDLVEALILRDASDLFKIKRVDAFRKLLTLLAGQIGSLLNLSELASICNVDVGTINSYIEILEESHIIKRIIPYAGGKRREIKASPKILFIDNGIRNQLLNNFSTSLDLRVDKGQLFENWAFTEIYKSLPFQDSLKFWRSKSGAEVDFVIEHAGKIYGLEIKSTPLKKTKVSKSAWSFMDAYDPEEFAILNTALEQDSIIGNKRIKFITPYSLLDWLKKVFNDKG